MPPAAGRWRGRDSLIDFTSFSRVGPGLRRRLCRLRGGRRCAGLFGPLVRSEADIRTVLFDELLRYALDHRELVDALEWPVLLAVAHDGLGLRRPDAVERLRERGGIGGVDVD